MDTLEPTAAAPETPVPLLREWPQIAGFWRRLAAGAVDWLLIGAVGQAIALPFTAYWSQIGPYGRFVGIGIVFAYFGLMNSKVGKGQTVGKRIFKIAVRGPDNESIGVLRSLARIAVLTAPLFLAGWALPFPLLPEMSWLTGLLVFGLTGAIAFTMVVNIEARQGIHDLVCRTYVVDTTTMLVEQFPDSERYHWIISGALLGFAAIVWTLWNTHPPPPEVAAPLQDIHGLKVALQADPRFFKSDVSITLEYIPTLDVELWYRGVRTADEQRRLRLEIAALAMKNVERIYQFDYLMINVRSAYDLGIAAGQSASEEIHYVPVWRQMVGSNPAP